MEINNSEIVSIFNKLGGKNEYVVKILFDRTHYKLSRHLFEKIVQRLVNSEANGGLQLDYKMETHLEVLRSDSKYQLRVDGKDNVKRYWQFGQLPDVPYIMFEEVEMHDVEKYGIKVVLVGREEKEVEKQFETGGEKEYRLVNTYVVEDAQWDFETRLIEEKRVISDRDFKGSAVLGAIPNYYLEIVLRHDLDVNKQLPEGGEGQATNFMDYFGRYLRWIFEELQQTSFIVSLDDKESLHRIYKKLTKLDKFSVAEPVEVLRRNFHKSERFPYVRENYATSYLMDGELRLLFVSENFSDAVDGKLFMITEDGDYINTGKQLKGFENSLLEGYYSVATNLFLITDILYYKGNDVRKEIFYKQGGGAKDKYRFDYLMQFYREGVQASTYVNPELRDEATKIVITKYLFGGGSLFEENIEELFEKQKLQDFPVSGLLFRPMDKPYPEKGGNWYELMKWNYPQFRTAQFLVKYVKHGHEVKVSPFQLPARSKDVEGRIIPYKSLQMLVSGAREIRNKKIVTTVEFSPTGTDPEANIGMANIPLSDDGIAVAHDPIGNTTDEIMDNSVVEFVYQRIYGEFTDLFKWTPVRVNHGKTRMVREGKISAVMSENFANHIWNSLSNPISDTQLKEGTVPEEDLTSLYYAVNNDSRLKTYPYQLFIKAAKDRLLESVAPAKGGRQQGALLDLMGGGSLKNWKDVKLKDVVSLDEKKEDIDRMREQYKKEKTPKPNVEYIWGDVSKLIFPNFEVAMDRFSGEILRKAIKSKFAFDVVSVQNDLWKMFADEITVRTLLQNVTDNLKIGGHFIGSVLDGKLIFDMMKGAKKPEEGMIGDDLLWKVDKKYTAKTWDSAKPMTGHKVEIYSAQKGVPEEQYLVNVDYMVKLAKDYGLELVEKANYGKLFDGEEYKTMTTSEKTFSFLHTQFTLVKKKDAPDAVYNKLVTMIEKKAKRDAKPKKFVGGSKKLKIKLR